MVGLRRYPTVACRRSDRSTTTVIDLLLVNELWSDRRIHQEGSLQQMEMSLSGHLVLVKSMTNARTIVSIVIATLVGHTIRRIRLGFELDGQEILWNPVSRLCRRWESIQHSERYIENHLQRIEDHSRCLVFSSARLVFSSDSGVGPFGETSLASTIPESAGLSQCRSGSMFRIVRQKSLAQLHLCRKWSKHCRSMSSFRWERSSLVG